MHTELPFQQSLWNVIIKKQSLWNVCAVMVNVCADLAMVNSLLRLENRLLNMFSHMGIIRSLCDLFLIANNSI